jgi:hypothetical protein
MVEGMEYDDKWRMVEDEFLSVAQMFTVHLHAAEYKRQQKMVKSRNADTINSISRPVTGKMPEHTKRKLEAVARATNQKSVVEDVAVKKAEDDDDSDDGGGLPYFGTTLHGLMDSPRKKAASLAKSGTIIATTRAAAGFKQSAVQLKPDRKQESPQSKVAIRATKAILPNDPVTESSEDDDDLDAPIPAPKLTTHVRKSAPHSELYSQSSTGIIETTRSFPEPKKSSLATAETKSFSGSIPQSNNVSPEIFSRPSRLEQARRQKAKLEKEKKEKQTLDIIPTFL